MNISGVSADTVAAFLLALVRASAWLSVSPPFNGRTIPGRVKAGLAFTLALAAAPKVKGSQIPLDTGGFIGSVLVQVAIGVTLGFLALLLFVMVDGWGLVVRSLVDSFR